MQISKQLERRMFLGTGLAAARIGSVSTGILLFASSGSLAGNFVTVVNSATLGTTVKAIERGMYQVTLDAVVPASGGAAFGISVDAAAASLLSGVNPIVTTADILAGAHAIAPAATQIPVHLSYAWAVTDAMAGNPAAAILRFHGNDGAAGDLAAGDVISAQVRWRIVKIGDLMGS